MDDLFSRADIVDRAAALFAELDGMALDEKVDAINRIRLALHEKSPFREEPIDCVLWVRGERVHANEYNPNTVAPPEMKLLDLSIRADGYTQPVVTFAESSWEKDHTVVDGFHRTRVGKESKAVRERVHGYLPVSMIQDHRTGIKDRMAATIRHNRARGVHGVLRMVDIVAELIRQGWQDSEIAKELGMDADEVLRFKQNSGLPELFKDHEYSRSWE